MHKEVLSLRKEVLPMRKEVLPLRKEALPVRKEVLPMDKQKRHCRPLGGYLPCATHWEISLKNVLFSTSLLKVPLLVVYEG